MQKEYTDLTADELAEVHNISVAAAQEIIDARRFDPRAVCSLCENPLVAGLCDNRRCPRMGR